MEEWSAERSGRKKCMTGMEEAPENGKESPHSVHANGLIEALCQSCMLKWWP